jgi:hypothetical protein
LKPYCAETSGSRSCMPRRDARVPASTCRPPLREVPVLSDQDPLISANWNGLNLRWLLGSTGLHPATLRSKESRLTSWSRTRGSGDSSHLSHRFPGGTLYPGDPPRDALRDRRGRGMFLNVRSFGVHILCGVWQPALLSSDVKRPLVCVAWGQADCRMGEAIQGVCCSRSGMPVRRFLSLIFRQASQPIAMYCTDAQT